VNISPRGKFSPLGARVKLRTALWQLLIPRRQSRENDDSTASEDSVEVLRQVERVIGHQLVVDGGPREPLRPVL
jgi:hypothetical protein